MATSMSYDFDPTSSEMLDEVFERCGLDPANVTARHAKSFLRSMNLLLKHWSNTGILQWPMEQETHTTVQGETNFALDVEAIEAMNVIVTRAGVDFKMYAMTRDEYNRLSDKTTQGRPLYYFVQKGITPTFFYYPAAQNNTDVIKYWQYRKIQDNDNLLETIDVPSRYLEALVAGVTAEFAKKFAVERANDLAAYAKMRLDEALAADRERADVQQRNPAGYNG